MRERLLSPWRHIAGQPWLAGHPWRRRGLVVAAVALLAAGALAGAVAARGPFFFMSCSLDDLRPRAPGEAIVLVDRNGVRLGTAAVERNRDAVPLARVAPVMRTAIVAVEDRRFHEHDGVDLLAIVRALRANTVDGEVEQGGSTITQQLVRTLYLGSERTLGRKLREGCLAVKLEREWSKGRILEAYLNAIPFGHRAFGVEAASWTYFGKPAARLGLREAALLAGLPQAPSAYDPFARPGAAAKRRSEVLDAMVAAGAVDRRQAARVAQSALGLRPRASRAELERGYLKEAVLGELEGRYAHRELRRGGLRVRLTVDGRLQLLAERALASVLRSADGPAGALVALDPRTGAVRAFAAAAPGTRALSFDLVSGGARQPGSTFKTFVLAEALRRGINPWATQYLSAPFAGPGDWEVKTYDGTYAGRITIADATVRSDNTVFARLALDLGPGRVAALAASLGVTAQVEPVPSVGLGTTPVSVLDMASAYATVAAGGVHREPRLVARVSHPEGAVDRFVDTPSVRVLEQPVAGAVTRILEANVRAGTGTAAAFGRPAAGKTGTTDDYADAWFVGYTPQLVAAVWVGHPEGRRRLEDEDGDPVTGGSLPAEIWRAFMAPAHRALPPRAFPEPESLPTKPWCGRYQHARTAADAKPRNGCPLPKPDAVRGHAYDPATGVPVAQAPEPAATAQPPATTENSPPATTAPPPATTGGSDTETVPDPEPTEPPPPPQTTGTDTTATTGGPEYEPDASAVVGQTGTAVERVTGSGGVVDVGGALYRARAEDPAAPIPAGETVDVVSAEGDVAVVAPV